MVAAMTTTDLLGRVRAQAQLPSADGRLTDAELLALADEVLRTTCADLLVGARGQWWTTAATDVPITSGVASYAMPERALAEGLSDVLVVQGTSQWSAPEIPLTEAWRYRTTHGGWASPYAYAWRDDVVELLPTPTDSSYSLRLLYPRRPSRLVTAANCARVATTGTTSLVVASVPSGWTSAETVDVIGGANGRPRGQDLIASLASTTITLAVPTGTAVGDYVCLAGETCVPPVSEVLFDVLTTSTVFRVLAAIGDPEGMSAASVIAQAAVARATSLVSPRNRGASRKIVAHGYGTRRGRRR